MSQNLPEQIFPLDDDAPSPDGASLFLPAPEADAGLPALVPVYRNGLPVVRRGFSGKRLRKFFEEWFADDRSLADLYPYRIHVAWRIVREMAVLRGVLLDPKDNLGTAPVDIWRRPFSFYARQSTDPVVNAILAEHKLPLLPPFPQSVENGETRKYDVRHDAPLHAYVRLIDHIARSRLFVQHTTHGRYGIAGLLQPEIIRVAMPRANEILYYERELIRATLVQMDEHSGAEVEKWLAEKHDLQEREIVQVMRMARAHAVEMVDLDNERAAIAMAIRRMEHLERKMEDSLDFRGAVFARDKIMRLRLAQHGGKDETLEDMTRVVEAHVREVKQRRPELPAGDD